MFAEKVKKGSVFSRFDRNGKEWIATVSRRTDFFVIIELKNPYGFESSPQKVEIRQKCHFEEGEINDEFFGKRIDEIKILDDDYFIELRYSTKNAYICKATYDLKI